MNGIVMVIGGVVIAITFLYIGMAIGEIRYGNRPGHPPDPHQSSWDGRMMFGEDHDE